MTNQLNIEQVAVLEVVRTATGRQVVDRSIATKYAQQNLAVYLDSVLELELVTYKNVRWNVGTPAHPIFTTTPMLYLTKFGRQALTK